MNAFDVNIPIGLQAADADNITLALTAVQGEIPLNGVLATLQGAILPVAGHIFINSVGDDSGITFTITGLLDGEQVTEVLAGTNASTAESVNDYDFISSIVSSGATAANITVGFIAGQDQLALAQALAGADPVDLDGNYKSAYDVSVGFPCYLSLTCAADETANEFTIVGYDVNGQEITKTFAGVSATTYTIPYAFQTITSFSCSQDCAGNISLGTLAQTYSQWVKIDGQRDFLAGAAAAIFDTGATMTVTLEYGWFSTPYSPTSTLLGTVEDTILNADTASTATTFNNPADAVRLKITAWTSGGVYFCVRQANSGHAAPY